MICRACPRRCGAERNEEKGYGFCGMPTEPVLARAALHFGEEPCLSGDNGSGTVFFTGCNLGCVFCQNDLLSQERKGKTVTVSRLAEIFRELENAGANNINLVTPSHYTEAIRAALKIYRPSIPIVYNASGYDDPEILRSLRDTIDIYLLDFKFWSNERAHRYTQATNYPDIAKQNILVAADAVAHELQFDDNGIMKKGLIVRHLILPQGTRDAIEIIRWCNQNVPFAAFSLMSQYLPCGKAGEYPEINRTITPREQQKVTEILSECDFPVMYTQSIASATGQMIPDFDFTGI